MSHCSAKGRCSPGVPLWYTSPSDSEPLWHEGIAALPLLNVALSEELLNPAEVKIRSCTSCGALHYVAALKLVTGHSYWNVKKEVKLNPTHAEEVSIAYNIGGHTYEMYI